MRFFIKSSVFFAIILAVFTSCDNSETDQTTAQVNTPTGEASAVSDAGLRIAFIYGDTINAKYNFLIDAEDELERERKLIDDRMQRKLSRAEARARELQQQAPTMTQMQMQEAQLELQNLDLEMQQFQESLATDFRKRETALQLEYVAIVDSFLEAYNADGKYDMILNFQRGGNLLWVNKGFDITAEVLEGLNKAYAERLSAKKSEAAKKE
jgi:outer membrane protein